MSMARCAWFTPNPRLNCAATRLPRMGTDGANRRRLRSSPPVPPSSMTTRCEPTANGNRRASQARARFSLMNAARDGPPVIELASNGALIRLPKNDVVRSTWSRCNSGKAQWTNSIASNPVVLSDLRYCSLSTTERCSSFRFVNIGRPRLGKRYRSRWKGILGLNSGTIINLIWSYSRWNDRLVGQVHFYGCTTLLYAANM